MASTTRVTGSSESRTAGKSFSTVLQTLRSDQGRHDSREARAVRISDKADERSDTRETTGLSVSPSRAERSDASSRQMVVDKTVKGSEEEEDVENSEVELESSSPSSEAGARSPEQHPTALEPMVVAQVAASTAEQTKLNSGRGSLCTNCGDESDEDPGTPQVISTLTTASSTTVVNTTQTHTPENNRVTAVPEAQAHTRETSITQTGVEVPAAQPIKPDVPIAGNRSGEPVVEQGETRPVMPESKSVSIPLSQTLRAPQTGQMDLDQIRSDNQSALTKDMVIQPNPTAPPTLPYGQVHPYAQNFEDHAGLSVKPEILVAQGQQLNGDTTGQSSEWWTEQQTQQQGNSEAQSYKTAANNLQAVNGQAVEPFAIAAPGQTFSTPAIHAPSSLVASAHPGVPTAELTPQSIGSVIRSVVVDVAQPELGHVSVRVSMMNDSVHAHFSTDRAEVGQFLMNGQDRLQTTLQANGLDMGQFRVDIDRQNSGRSFQQGSFQEQGQAWNHGSHGLGKEQVLGRPDEGHLILQGRLNLVA
ncbi:MAG: flagellar hook-length control protein FliK [Nitrospira sp.]